MPTYDYRCRACGHRFEAFQSMTEKSLEICPSCGKPEVERLISPGGGLLFKGSGFYITDYRKESYKTDSKKDSGEKPSDSKKDSGGSGTSKGADSKKDSGDSKPKASTT